MSLLRSATFAAAALCWTAFAAATGTAGEESHDRLQRLAESHALEIARSLAPPGADVKAEAVRLDPRLHLSACAVTPETFDPPGQPARSEAVVGLRCPAGASWSLYVPVRLSITVDVVVLTAPAARGDVLDASKLALEPRDVARLSGGYLAALADAKGLVLRRLVRPGTVLTQAMLERPRLVQRGQRVRIRAEGGGLVVDAEGEALADAAQGDRVRVRNTRSGLVVEGVVDRAGNVVAGF